MLPDMLREFLEIEKKYMRILTKTAQNFGLTVSEWVLLGKIEEGKNTQSQLAKDLQLDVSTLSRQLKGLVTKGLLAKGSKTPEKNFYYEISSAGQKTFKQMTNALEKLAQQLFSTWSAEDKKRLQELMLNLNQGIMKISENN